MKIQRIWAVAAASVMTLSTAATAQQTTAAIPGQPVERITFQQAIEIALKQNVLVQQAENNIYTSELTVQQAGSSIWPTLNLSFGGGNSVGKTFDQSTASLVTKMSQSASAQVGTSITLLDFSRGHDVASARSNLDASQATLFRQKQTTVYTVALQFVAYAAARSQLDVQKENLASLQLSESQIQRFADAGARPISDLYSAKSQVATAQLAVVNAEQAIENAKFALMQTLQLDPAKDYEFVKPDVPVTVTAVNYNLDSLTSLAYTRRRDATAAQQRLDAARYTLRGDARGHWPTLSLSGGYGTNGRFGQDQTINSQFEQNRSGSVSASLNINVFDRGQTRIARTRDAIAVENAELQLRQTRQQVALDVRTAWYNIRSAQQRLVAAQAGLVAATQALEAMQQRYLVGAATLLEVSQLRAQRVNAQSSLADAQYNYVLNTAAMAYFTGDLDPEGRGLISGS
jgi:outer membrane protein